MEERVMKTANYLIMTIFAICIIGQAAENTIQLEGTCECISSKTITNDSTTISFPREGFRMIRIMNKTHFSVMRQGITEQETYMFVAGTYKLDQDVLTENIEFCTETWGIGSVISYKVQKEGDQFTMSGLLIKRANQESKWELYEVWKKID
jgi:hypothetical protein